MIFRNMRPVEVNIGREAAILNFIDFKFFRMHPLLKPYNLFYSIGVAILSGFHDISQYEACGGEYWPRGGYFKFYRPEIFQDASSPE